MGSNCLKWFTPISSNITVLLLLSFTIVSIAFLFILGIFSISQKLFFSMIILAASIALIFALTIFTGITYNSSNNGNDLQANIFSFKKKFLFLINTLFIIVLGAISFCLYSFRNDIFKFVDLAFKDYYNSQTLHSSKSEKFVKYMEIHFKCQRFDSNSTSGNCAEPVQKFLNTKYKLSSIILGIVSIFCLVLFIVSIVIDLVTKSGNGSNIKNDRSEDVNDYNQELNPSVAADF